MRKAFYNTEYYSREYYVRLYANFLEAKGYSNDQIEDWSPSRQYNDRIFVICKDGTTHYYPELHRTDY